MRTFELPWRSSEIDHRDAGFEDAKWLHKALYYETTNLETLLDVLNLLC